MCRLIKFSRGKDQREVSPLSRPVMIQSSDTTGIRSIAERPSLLLSSRFRIAVVGLTAFYPLRGAIRIYPVPLE
jgi:hypothetical protein